MPLVNRIARFPELANWKVGFISRKESKGNSRVRYEIVFKSRFWPSLHDDPRQQTISEAGHRRPRRWNRRFHWRRERISESCPFHSARFLDIRTRKPPLLSTLCPSPRPTSPFFSPTDKSRSDPCNRRSSSKWKYWKRKKITRESLSNDGTNVVPDGRWTCHNLLSWIRNCYVRMRGSASCCRVGCILPVASIMPFTGKSTRWNKDSHDATSTVNALFLSRCWDHLFSSNCCVMAIGL